MQKQLNPTQRFFIEAFQDALNNFRDEAGKRAEEEEEKRIEKEFKNPKKIETANRVTFGKNQAPVTIVEFSDFQCPYCARASTQMKALIDRYEGKVNVVYKHFPLSFHPFAKPAAIYFEAVAMESHALARKFHDQIFDNFEEYARISGDDIEKN